MRYQKTQQKVFKVVHFFLYSPVNIGETAGKPKICGYSKLCSQVLEAYTSLPGQTSNRVINSPASCSFLSGTYIQENSYPLWPTFIRMLQLLDLLPLTKILQAGSQQLKEYTAVTFCLTHLLSRAAACQQVRFQ